MIAALVFVVFFVVGALVLQVRETTRPLPPHLQQLADRPELLYTLPPPALRAAFELLLTATYRNHPDAVALRASILSHLTR